LDPRPPQLSSSWRAKPEATAIPFSHSHTLSHTKESKEEERRGKEKGIGDCYSGSSPWNSPRSLAPQVVGVGRGRSPLTITIWSKEEKEIRRGELESPREDPASPPP